jgi:hypothetical protein
VRAVPDAVPLAVDPRGRAVDTSRRFGGRRGVGGWSAVDMAAAAVIGAGAGVGWVTGRRVGRSRHAPAGEPPAAVPAQDAVPGHTSTPARVDQRQIHGADAEEPEDDADRLPAVRPPYPASSTPDDPGAGRPPPDLSQAADRSTSGRATASDGRRPTSPDGGTGPMRHVGTDAATPAPMPESAFAVGGLLPDRHETQTQLFHHARRWDIATAPCTAG